MDKTAPAPPDTPLRDRLAVQRTELANERTVLAYGRTAIMLVSTGVVALRVYGGAPLMATLGAVLVALGVGVSVIGGWRFLQVRRSLAD